MLEACEIPETGRMSTLVYKHRNLYPLGKGLGVGKQTPSERPWTEIRPTPYINTAFYSKRDIFNVQFVK